MAQPGPNFGRTGLAHRAGPILPPLLRDKQETKFKGVMSAQNTHHIPAFDHVFNLSHLVISVFIVVYLILSFFVHFR